MGATPKRRKTLPQIPEFANDDDERDFWMTHSMLDYEYEIVPNHVRIRPGEDLAAILAGRPLPSFSRAPQKTKMKQPISITREDFEDLAPTQIAVRLSSAQVKFLRKKAKELGCGHITLARRILEKWIEANKSP